MDGVDLLTEFRTTRAETAFSALVRRYTGLVYSVAHRRVTDRTLAEEVTQLVFIRLAKSPPNLETEARLLAWLHRTTLHVSVDLWRSETRRRAREYQAMTMEPERHLHAEAENSRNRLSPVLDEALNELTESDRQVLLLRFFEQHSMADLGRRVGVSEDAAKMRVSRALERLRVHLGTLGASCSALALGTLLGGRSQEEVPPSLQAQLASLRLPLSGGIGSSFGSWWPTTVAGRLAVGGTAVLLLGGLAVGRLHVVQDNPSPNPIVDVPAAVGPGSAAGTEIPAAARVETKTEPDPLALLQTVALARQRLTSGTVDIDWSARHRGDPSRPDSTNRLQLTTQFDGNRFWVESMGEEYRYVTPVPDSPEAEAIIRRADTLPRHQAVREGLLQAFPSHHVSYYDGQAVTDYWETDDALGSTTVDRPGRGSHPIFNPRCFGLSVYLSPTDQIENCLAYPEAKALTLAGQERIDGRLAWHVQVVSKEDSRCDFWIDVLQPTHLLKLTANGRVALMQFSSSDPQDPLPTEMRSFDSKEQGSRYELHLVRGSTRYEAAIDPATWTLGSLRMKVGTPVSDNRIHRRIGYWTGTGLSDDLPRVDRRRPTPPDQEAMLTLLEQEPSGPAAFDAAKWILHNSPDGPGVQKAAEVLLEEHLLRPDLVPLTLDLERLRHRSSSNLLQAMMSRNPSREVRGNACFALATLRKSAAEFGRIPTATAEAEALFERAMVEFGEIKRGGRPLAELAGPEIAELRGLSLGKPAPEFEGQDFGGQSRRLADFRGKVVVLWFWSALCTSESEVQSLRRLVEQYEGKPFALLGVHADDAAEKARAFSDQLAMAWPSIQDARRGPIALAYHIESWPSFYVLDRRGLIRYRGLFHRQEIAAAVDALLTE